MINGVDVLMNTDSKDSKDPKDSLDFIDANIADVVVYPLRKFHDDRG